MVNFNLKFNLPDKSIIYTVMSIKYSCKKNKFHMGISLVLTTEFTWVKISRAVDSKLWYMISYWHGTFII